MKSTPLAIPDVILFEPRVFGDERGFFFESFNQRHFEEAVGRPVQFVQDNHSRSSRNVLRGLHYQLNQAQGKLVAIRELVTVSDARPARDFCLPSRPPASSLRSPAS